MAIKEFTGELDAPVKIKPFDGELDDAARQPLPVDVTPSNAGAGRGTLGAPQTAADAQQRVPAPRRGGVRSEVKPYGAGDARVPAPTPVPEGGSVFDRAIARGDEIPEPPLTDEAMEWQSLSPAKQQEILARQRYAQGFANAPEARPASVATEIGASLRDFTDNPVARGAAAGLSQLGQVGAGLVRAGADAVGAEGVADFARGAAGQASEVAGGAVQGLRGNDQLAANITSSIVNSVPAVALGTVGGPALRTLFAQSAAADYAENGNLARAGMMGAAEALGERFGFAEQIRLLKGALRGMPNDDVAKVLGNMLAKEIPGEQATTAMQFLIDKAGPGARNPNATFADYLKQAGETLEVTIGQTAVMGGGPALVSTTRNEMARADRATERSAMNPAERAAADAGFLRPSQQRKATFDRLDDFAATHGVSSTAVKALKERADGMPQADVPGFLKRALAAMSKRGLVARPVGDTELAALDDPAAAQPEAPATTQAIEAPELLDEPVRTPIDDGAHQAATSPENDRPEPTQAQKEAGNYKVGRARIAGMDISIENPQGSMRRGVDADGKPWETEMRSHYGYFRGTTAPDGDKLDVFVKPGTADDFDGPVFVVDQIDPKTGKFDEHKTLLGFSSIDEARRAYQENYEPGWRGLGSITAVPMPAFRAWAKSRETRRPLGTLDEATGFERLDDGLRSGADAATNLGPTRAGFAQPGGQPQVPVRAAPSTVDGGNAAPSESLVDGRVGDTSVRGDGLQRGAAVSHGDGPLDGPAQAAELVLGGVSGPSGDGQVVDGVVEPVAVTVVDKLVGSKRPADAALNDEAVLKPLASNAIDNDADKAVAGTASKRSNVPAGGRTTHVARSKSEPNVTHIIARAGRTPNSATPIELRANPDGTLTPYMDGEPMADYDSGAPIVLPADVTDLAAKQAIRAAGAVSNKTNFFKPDGKDAAAPAQDTGVGGSVRGDTAPAAAAPDKQPASATPAGSAAATSTKESTDGQEGLQDGRRQEALTPVESQAAAGRGGPAAAKSRLTPLDDERLAQDDFRTALEQASADIGWTQRGGQLIRSGVAEAGEGNGEGGRAGAVVGRTQWLGLELWAQKPEPIGEDEAREAIRKALAGEPLTARQKRFVQYVLEHEADRVMQDRESAAEAEAERAAIMAEAGIGEMGMASLNDDDIPFDYRPEAPSGSTEGSAQGEDARQAGRAEEAKPAEVRAPDDARSEEARADEAGEVAPPTEADALRMGLGDFTQQAEKLIAMPGGSWVLLDGRRASYENGSFSVAFSWGNGKWSSGEVHGTVQDAYRTALKRWTDRGGKAAEFKPADRAQFASGTQGPDLLTAPTPESLRADADRRERADAADRAEQKRLADKAKADAARDEFTLTGSDSARDEAAAAGQGDLLAVPASRPEKTPEQARTVELRKRLSVLEALKECLNG